MPGPLTGGHIGLFYKWDFGQTGWNTGMDANLKALEILVGLNVKSRTTTAPPGSPADWDTYLVPSAGLSGAWVGNGNKYAYWLGGVWNYLTPREGQLFSCEDSADDGKVLKWESGAVVEAGGSGGVVNLSDLADVDLTGLADGDLLTWDTATSTWIVVPYPTGLPPSGAAGGDLSGTYPNPAVAKVNGVTFTITTPATGQVMRYNGSAFVNAALASDDLSDVAVSGAAAGQTLIYNGSAFANRLPIDPIASFVNGKPSASLVMFRYVAARAFSLPNNLTGSYFKAGTAATASTAFDIQKNGVSIGTLTFAAAGTSATFAVTGTSFAAGDILTVHAPGSQDATLADLSITILPD